ncbi:MAG: SET domain-containing protein-lysine N-methyltransferase [Gemmatimonadota bacterium]
MPTAKRGPQRPERAPARRGKRSAPNPWLVMRRSAIQGRGVYARVDIPCGTRLIEYTGERISHAEADRRDDEERRKRHHTFLFILNSRTVIDARHGGNISKYINHSCEPNCEARFAGAHIWVHAIRDIGAGEELAYDYEYDWLPDYTVKDLAEYACRCGSERCRGTLVDLPADQLHVSRALLANSFAAGA